MGILLGGFGPALRMDKFVRSHGLERWLDQLQEQADDPEELREGLTGSEFDDFVSQCGMPGADAGTLTSGTPSVLDRTALLHAATQHPPRPTFYRAHHHTASSLS